MYMEDREGDLCLTLQSKQMLFLEKVYHSLGAFFNTPHGVANAIVLSDVIDFDGRVVPEEVIDLGKAMGLKDDELTVDTIVAKLKKLNKKIKIYGGIKL
jgi:alcohol dehydrogenase class IV